MHCRHIVAYWLWIFPQRSSLPGGSACELLRRRHTCRVFLQEGDTGTAARREGGREGEGGGGRFIQFLVWTTARRVCSQQTARPAEEARRLDFLSYVQGSWSRAGRYSPSPLARAKATSCSTGSSWLPSRNSRDCLSLSPVCPQEETEQAGRKDQR